MEIKYYVINDDLKGISSLLVTSRFEYWQNRVKLQISPPIGAEIFNLEDIKFKSISIGFDAVDAKTFQSVMDWVESHKCSISDMGISECNLTNISKKKLYLNRLAIEENVYMNLSDFEFRVLEVHFLSLKTFKGNFTSDFSSVEKLIVWHDKDKSDELVQQFKNITSLSITHSNVQKLSFLHLKNISRIELAYCRNLKSIFFDPSQKAIRLMVTKSKYINKDTIDNPDINLVLY